MKRLLLLIIPAVLIAGCGGGPEKGALQPRGDLTVIMGGKDPIPVSCPSGLPADAELCRQAARFAKETGGSVPAGRKQCIAVTELRGRITPPGETDSVRIFVPGWGCNIPMDAYPELKQAVEGIEPDLNNYPPGG